MIKRKRRRKQKTPKKVLDFIEAITLVHLEAEKQGFKKGKGGKGEMKCPVCGSTLYFSVASNNGHIWGKCTTDKCLCWME